MTAKQILEDAGLAESHWGKRIIRAEVRGKFTKADRRDAKNWVTCACGQVTADIPRHNDNRPVDNDLWLSGAKFACDVAFDRYIRAAKILIEIEKRAIEVAGGAK